MNYFEEIEDQNNPKPCEYCQCEWGSCEHNVAHAHT